MEDLVTHGCRNNHIVGNTFVDGPTYPLTYAVYSEGANSGGNVIENNWMSPGSSIYSDAPGDIVRGNMGATIVGTFAANDATPSVRLYEIYRTANTNPTTITMLDDGFAGQRVTVIINDAVTTVDFSGTNLKGNGGVDWSPSSGDFMDCVFDGTNWYCQVMDTTV
jgi:hypothetical protein